MSTASNRKLASFTKSTQDLQRTSYILFRLGDENTAGGKGLASVPVVFLLQGED